MPFFYLLKDFKEDRKGERAVREEKLRAIYSLSFSELVFAIEFLQLSDLAPSSSSLLSRAPHPQVLELIL